VEKKEGSPRGREDKNEKKGGRSSKKIGRSLIAKMSGTEARGVAHLTDLMLFVFSGGKKKACVWGEIW